MQLIDIERVGDGCSGAVVFNFFSHLRGEQVGNQIRAGEPGLQATWCEAHGKMQRRIIDLFLGKHGTGEQGIALV